MKKKIILLVEDNPDDQKLAFLAFERCHIPTKIVAVQDGKEALDYLFRTGPYSQRDPETMPAVILLDLNLPRLSGLDVLKKIRGDRRTQLLPVVILTSSQEEEDILACYHLGANSYIRKPVDFDQFTEAARQMGTYWLLLNETPFKKGGFPCRPPFES
jgi:two-component system, response regulator